MTSRSSKQSQHPKITTISRRLRNRADQNLSVQPPQLPNLRSVRARRAATLPVPRHNRAAHDANFAPELHSNSQTWESATPGLLEPLPLNSTSDPASAADAGHRDLITAQTLVFTPYEESPQAPHTELRPNTTGSKTAHYQLEPSPDLTFLPSPLTSVAESHDFNLPLPTEPVQSNDSFLHLQDMSTLGFMMPPQQYGMGHYGSPQTTYSPSYPNQPSYADPRSPQGGYGSYASSPALPNDQSRRPDDHAALPPYQTQAQPLSRSPYQQQQPMRSDSLPLTSSAHTYTYPATHGVQSQSLGSNSPAYAPQPVYPPSTYSMNDYQPLPTMYPPSSTTAAAYPSYGSPQEIAPPTNAVPLPSTSPGAQNNAVMPRILNSRPKPQCWEHGCNGRQFSTFSNLLRHQREKSGTASKSYCPRCGAEFTRTTARNGHMAHDKCKPRRASESSH